MEGQQNMVLWIMFAAGMVFSVLLIMAWIFIKRTAYLSPVKRELKKEKQWLRRGEYNAAMVKGRQNLELLFKVVAANNGIRLDNTAAAQANARSVQERNHGRRGRSGRNRVMTHQQFGWWMEENGYLDRVAKWEMNQVRLIGNKAVHENFISKEDAWNQYNYLEDILKMVSEKHPVGGKRKGGARSRGTERGPRVPETEGGRKAQKKNGKEGRDRNGKKDGAGEKPGNEKKSGSGKRPENGKKTENEKKPENGKKPGNEKRLENDKKSGNGKGPGQAGKKQSGIKTEEKKQTEKPQTGKREGQTEVPGTGNSGRGNGAQGKETDRTGNRKKDGQAAANPQTAEKPQMTSKPQSKPQTELEGKEKSPQELQETGKTAKKPSRRRRKKPKAPETSKTPGLSEEKKPAAPAPEEKKELPAPEGQKEPAKKSGNHRRRRRRKPSETAPAAVGAQGTVAAVAAKG